MMRVFSGTRMLTPSIAILLALLVAPAIHAKQPKQDVCHLDADSGTFAILNVAAPAVPAHLGHGDFLPLTFFADNDGDGFGAGPAFQGCEIPPGFADNDLDCDDTNAAIHPDADEVCNGIDDDCDVDVDEGLTFDDDGDGFTSLDSCEGSKDDCNDGDATVFPGATETRGRRRLRHRRRRGAHLRRRRRRIHLRRILRGLGGRLRRLERQRLPRCSGEL